MKITVLSIPHGGTSFTMHFLCNVIGADAKFLHFQPNTRVQIIKHLRDYKTTPDVLILPWRRPYDVIKTWLRRLGHKRDRFQILTELDACYQTRRECDSAIRQQFGVLPFCVHRSTVNYDEVNAILRATNQPWSPQVTEFLETWPLIGTRRSDSDTQLLSDDEVANLIKEIHECQGCPDAREFHERFQKIVGYSAPIETWRPDAKSISYEDTNLRKIMREQVLK